ncbi:glycogen synthase [Corynebacterium sp. Marseille-P3884]|uniref:glycogen synthase n=1 Tax=Corynebacterium sp. Marseille-P3884 TaxID=2495409 RepID=UPI001B3262CE|nr:glycogen synthase [Corynebacterium sp. Marseille-P3884]MBP3949380.1 glycogen synthase [Corynebacterium sp. Marseille-P3884]
MRVGMMTREYPPEIYGGAGVHVTELTRFMRKLDDVTVDVHCMGQPRDAENVYVHGVDPALDDANGAIKTMSTGLRMAHAASDVDIVHSHTWYSGLGGHLAGLLHGVPHVVTAHSLEPDRPWKREQLGGGYDVSSWSEKNAMENADAVIGVSAGMKDAILRAYPRIDASRVHVVLNGIDTSFWYPTVDAAGDLRGETDSAAADASSEKNVIERLGIDPSRPVVAFVGRITRQKGVPHLVKAAQDFDPDIQLILCAGAPDTKEIAEETEGLVDKLRAMRDGVHWVTDMLPKEDIRDIYSAADIFVCPSVYEPLGIVNLEAMACNTAVVASDVGGIPEVVVDGETGTLVHYDADDTQSFEKDLAAAVNALAQDAATTKRFAAAGLTRVKKEFTWDKIAQETVDVYKSLL